MPTVINGLPAHVLLIHVIVIGLPLAAAMTAVSAVWPAARAKLGFLTPATALVALIFVPITTNAGEWLREHLPNKIGLTNPLIRRHAELGGELLPWAIALFVVAAVGYGLGRRYDMRWNTGRAGPAESHESLGFQDSNVATRTRADKRALPVWITLLVAVVAVVVAVGSVVQVYRIGDSGAQAVWKGSVSQ